MFRWRRKKFHQKLEVREKNLNQFIFLSLSSLLQQRGLHVLPLRLLYLSSHKIQLRLKRSGGEAMAGLKASNSEKGY